MPESKHIPNSDVQPSTEEVAPPTKKTSDSSNARMLVDI